MLNRFCCLKCTLKESKMQQTKKSCLKIDTLNELYNCHVQVVIWFENFSIVERRNALSNAYLIPQ